MDLKMNFVTIGRPVEARSFLDGTAQSSTIVPFPKGTR